MVGTRSGWTRRARIVGAAGLLLAAATAAADWPVVHEYVRVRREALPATIGVPRAGRNPQAIRRGDRLLPAPTDPAHVTAGERTLAALPRDSAALDRMTAFRPDRETGPESTLRYHEAFNPSVVPFKRGQALDQLRRDGSLAVADRALRPVVVGGMPRQGGELFFGSVMIEGGGGPVPLPSVAPAIRILSYEAEPRTTVQFFRDGADNYWVRARRSGAVRLKWLSEAPSTYFSGQVAANVFLHDVPPAWLRALPPAFRQRAARVLAHLAVDRSAPVRIVLDTLVAYFRAFQPGTLPPSRGDLYLDLALSQRGVCRHRAYAFVITATAVGLPARFVANEAHAFVEVQLPELGWRRIDLGGAADLLQVSGAADKVVHRPRTPDPFPQPLAYRTGATRVAGAATVRGLREDQLRALRSPARGAAGAPGPTGRAGRAGGPGPTGPAGRAGHLGPTGDTTPGREPPAAPPDRAPPPGELSPGVVAVPTATRLFRHGSTGFRGDPLEVVGRVVATRGGTAGLHVEVHLRPLAGGRSRVLSTLVTGVAGRFDGKVTLPVDLELGDYRLVLVTVGDERRLGSTTE